MSDEVILYLVVLGIIVLLVLVYRAGPHNDRNNPDQR